MHTSRIRVARVQGSILRQAKGRTFGTFLDLRFLLDELFFADFTRYSVRRYTSLWENSPVDLWLDLRSWMLGYGFG